MAQLLLFANFVCSLWVIYQVWGKNRRFTDTEKLIWTISAVVFGVLTALIYYFTQNKKPNY